MAADDLRETSSRLEPEEEEDSDDGDGEEWWLLRCLRTERPSFSSIMINRIGECLSLSLSLFPATSASSDWSRGGGGRGERE